MTGRAMLRAVFAAAVLVMGLPYWLTPYATLKLPDDIVGLGLLVVFTGAAVLRFAYCVPFARVLWWLGLAAPVAVVLRVVVDVLRDPTSHNLWPFELVIAAAVGFGTAFVGVLAGTGLALLLGRKSVGDDCA